MAQRQQLKIVHVLHHSLSGEAVRKDGYTRAGGWHVRTAREISRRYPGLRLECWGPEKTETEEKVYEVDGMACRHFPSRPLPHLPGRELCPSLVRALRREAREGPLLVHLHGVYNPLAYHIALSLPGVPKLAQAHGDNPGIVNFRLGMRQRDWRTMVGILPVIVIDAIPELLAPGRIDHFFVLNQLELRAISRVAGRGRVEISTMGIDFDVFKPGDRAEARRKLGVAPASKCVLYAGALRRGKGIDRLLEAFVQVAGRHEDTVLLVAGDGRQKENLRELGRRLGIERKVCFLNWVDNDRLTSVYRAADVCVLPTLYEGLGMTAVEALACGARFIGSAVGGIPDVVRNFESGMLVPPGDTEALAAALLQSLQEEGDARPNREKARNVYGWPVIVDRTVAQYRMLAEKHYGRKSVEVLAN